MSGRRVQHSFNESRMRERRTAGLFWVCFGVVTVLAAIAVVLIWDGLPAVCISLALAVAAVFKVWAGSRYLRA